jgi:hypothetical protein
MGPQKRVAADHALPKKPMLLEKVVYLQVCLLSVRKQFVLYLDPSAFCQDFRVVLLECSCVAVLFLSHSDTSRKPMQLISVRPLDQRWDRIHQIVSNSLAGLFYLCHQHTYLVVSRIFLIASKIGELLGSYQWASKGKNYR